MYSDKIINIRSKYIQYTSVWGPIYIYVRTNIHLYEGQYTSVWGPIYICMRANIHLCEGQYTSVWGPIYICVRANVHLYEGKYTSVSGPIYICVRANIHLCEGQYTCVGANIHIITILKINIHNLRMRYVWIKFTIIKNWQQIIKWGLILTYTVNPDCVEGVYYSKTCLNRTPIGPAFIFKIDRCLAWTVSINKDFLCWDFM